MILNYITFFYFFSFLFYLLLMIADKKIFGKIATIITAAGFLGHTTAIILRWIESYQMGIGRAPLSNMYESLVFFSWTVILLYLLIEWRISNKSIGVFATPIAFLIMAYSSFSNSDIQPLLPALKSNWLIAHVITCFFGYAAFALSFGLSYMYFLRGLNKLNPLSTNSRLSRDKYLDIFVILFIHVVFIILIFILAYDSLIKNIGSDSMGLTKFLSLFALVIYLLLIILTFLIFLFQSIRRTHDLNTQGIILLIPIYNFFILFLLLFEKGLEKNNKYGPPDMYYDDSTTSLLKIVPNHSILEELSYQMVVIGFIMLTLGIITGAVWANSAWGTYWSWDPKETWSLITWFVYAAMLHSRLISGWRGKRLALFSIIGFCCVIFTYLGVNLLLSGLHSYGSS
ncbi:MAG: c-type cytochrome biogenesis protein CcsB [Deltaproteobacteria bacterium]|nr:c-type cytochrome biogenesis protein CcsB [Deltaproteobacteria bacterium]